MSSGELKSRRFSNSFRDVYSEQLTDVGVVETIKKKTRINLTKSVFESFRQMRRCAFLTVRGAVFGRVTYKMI